jgi:hypothetical protein
MGWNLFNYQKQLARDEPKTDLFSDTLFKEIKKKKRGATSPESEVRDLISQMLSRPFRQISGLTKGWTVDEMYVTYNKAKSFKANPPALLWKLIKEKNLEIKKQLSTN